MHRTLYVLVFAVPLTGWLMSSALGFQTVWFGVLPIPDVIERSKPVAEALKQVHTSLACLTLAIVAAHAAAALRHHWKMRDDVLAHMLPLVRRRDGRA